MEMAILDTHATVKELIGGGLQEKAAEAIVKAIKEGRGNELSHLASKEQVTLLEKDVANIMQNVATKADLADFKTEVKTEIAKIRTEVKTEIATIRTEVKTEIATIRTEIANVEKRLILMLGGSVVTICSIIIGVLKYL